MKKVLLTMLGFTLTAFAFWPAGGVKVVQSANTILNPQMVYLNDGSVIVAWHEQQGNLTAGHTYCQKLDTTGVAHWPASGVRVCMNDSLQWLDYDMVSDGQDVWFVWQDTRNDAGDIYAQKIDGSTGQRLWGDEGKAVCVKVGKQRLQTCAILSSGNFVVTWVDYSVEPVDIAVQWFDSNDNPLWEIGGLFATRNTGGGYSPIVFPSKDVILDVWVGKRTVDTLSAYFAQRIDSAGKLLFDTSGILIEHAVNFYDVCSDGKGGAVVLFMVPETFEYAVQRIDSSGNVCWTSGGVIIMQPSLSISNSPKIPLEWPLNGLITDSLGGCFAWFGKHTTLTASLRVQHIDSSGNLKWKPTGCIFWTMTSRASAGEAKLSSDGNGGLMIVFNKILWDSPSWPPSEDMGILVQRVDAAGQILFDTNGMLIKTWNPDSLPLPDDFEYSSVDIPGGVITCWKDNRHEPVSSLYAQIVDTTGKIGSGIEEIPLPVTPLMLDLSSVINTTSLTVKYSVPDEEPGILKLFDSLGRLIEAQKLNQRKGVITLDTRYCPQGVYFLQLKTQNKTLANKTIILH